jgi:E3 ubiquitin-protein ligase NEDD4
MTNLPIAHTCFNRLDLPAYPDYDTLKVAMDYISQNEILGFGIDE